MVEWVRVEWTSKTPLGKLSCLEETYEAEIPEGMAYHTHKDTVYYDGEDFGVWGTLTRKEVIYYEEDDQ